MFRTKLLLTFCWLIQFAFSQDKAIDSLRAVLKNSQADTTRIKTLNTLSNKLLFTDAIKYKPDILHNLIAVQDLAGKLGTNKGLGMANHILGRAYDGMNLKDSASYYYLRAVAHYERANNYEGLSRVYQSLGRLYFYLGNLNECYKYCDLNLQARIKLNNPKDLGPAFMFKAVVVQNMRDSIEAARKYFQKAIELESKHNDKIDLGRLYNNYGSYLLGLKKYPDALDVFSLAYDLGSEIKDTFIVAFSSYSKAQAYYHLKNFKKAKESLYMPIAYWTKTDHFEDLANGNTVMAQVLYELGEYKVSIQYMNRAQALRDSIAKLANIRNINELEAKFQVEKKDKELLLLRERSILETLEKEKQQNRNTMLMIGIAVLVILGGIILFAFNNKRKANKLLDAEKKLVEKQRNILEVKNKEILDSISYAKRIQSTQMTSEKYIDKTLERLFNEKKS